MQVLVLPIFRARSWLFLSGLVFTIQNGAAQFVEISATIELISYHSGDTNAEARAKPGTISVICATGTNRWRIENDWSLNSVNKWFFDGTNVYKSLQIVKPPAQELSVRNAGGLPAVPFDEARSNLTINIWPSPDGHPLGDEAVNIPWLAFCSGTYLKRQDRLIPLPVELLRHTPDRYAYSDQTTTFGDAFGLPRSVDLFLSKSRYLVSVEDFYKGWGTRYLERMKAAVTNLHEGTRTFHYSVTATTNFLGWTFPLRFEFFQQGRDFIQNGNWSRRGTGTLKSIRQVAEPKGLFEPGLNQTVVDWRFRDEVSGTDANLYAWTNAVTPRTNDAALQEKFKQRIEEARRHKERAKSDAGR